MRLSETTFEEFAQWVASEGNAWRRNDRYDYMIPAKVKIIYDYCVNHGMKCEGNRMRVTWKRNEFLSQFTEPIIPAPTETDYKNNLFHEVWCKAEWAIRCTKSTDSIGYESVKGEFGLPIIKQLREAS